MQPRFTYCVPGGQDEEEVHLELNAQIVDTFRAALQDFCNLEA